MSSSKKNDVISVAPPHSIKKFELISEYVKAWINILMLNKKCRGIVYIDCMSNSGVYKDDNYIDICGYAALGGEIAAGKELFPREKGKKVYDDAVDALRHSYMFCENALKEDDTNEE